MKRIIILLTVVIFFMCCNHAGDVVSTSNIQMDTLKVKVENYQLDSLYKRLLTTYRKTHGIVIPEYYAIIDSLSLKLNSDSSDDEILVLSPVVLDDPALYRPKIDSVPKRLLVEIIKTQGESKMLNSYNNLISNVGGVLFNFTGLQKSEDGFSIKHEAGNKATYSYSIYLIGYKEKLIIKSIKKECGYEGENRTFDYTYQNLNAESLNLKDTLAQNCNCDVFWSELMKQKK